jgi:hypothetical protein
MRNMTVAGFLITVMGCGEGEAPCQQIRLFEARYETEAACIAETEAVLMRNLEGDYPIVIAQCHRTGAVPTVRPTQIKLPAPEHAALFRP